MADTSRTVADMASNLFQDSQAAGSITPQDLRDFVETCQTKQGSIYPCCDKSSMEKKNKETKEDYFKDSSTKLSHDELGLLPNDLNELLNNNASFKVKEGDFVKTKTNKKASRWMLK